MREIAQEEGVEPRTVYRWVADLEREGARALAKKPRADRGRPRIPDEALHLITNCLLSNPATTSAQMIHRTLMRAVPDAMEYTRSGKAAVVSPKTVERVRAALLADPHARLLFYDAGQRREYMRTSTGTVLSNHANDLWEMDMTRCDVEVVDPERRAFFRPRIHAIIDVYSGCIPGLAFSESEDQTQTDLALLRALLPKGGPFAASYPIFGRPQRMYWDNGKTYVSGHAERILRDLDVLSVHSKPRVSHTRGKIERFFGTFHGFERTFSSYVGENAVKRSSEELRVLRENTERWLDGGRDPGPLKRHPTLVEYQNAVLAWLVAEYHATVLHGKTRLQHFVETAPRASQLTLDPDELLLLFARRETRVVTLDGGVKIGGQLWKIPDGTLAAYARCEVLVLEDQFLLSDRRLIVYPERGGLLRRLGEAVPAPHDAGSIAAGDQRRAEKGVKRQALAEAREARDRLVNPELTVSRSLLKEAAVVIEPRPLPAGPARLAAVNPVAASEDPELAGFADDIADTTDITQLTPDELLARIKQRYS